MHQVTLYDCSPLCRVIAKPRVPSIDLVSTTVTIVGVTKVGFAFAGGCGAGNKKELMPTGRAEGTRLGSELLGGDWAERKEDEPMLVGRTSVRVEWAEEKDEKPMLSGCGEGSRL
jgi:hypothetical protein